MKKHLFVIHVSCIWNGSNLYWHHNTIVIEFLPIGKAYYRRLQTNILRLGTAVLGCDWPYAMGPHPFCYAPIMTKSGKPGFQRQCTLYDIEVLQQYWIMLHSSEPSPCTILTNNCGSNSWQTNAL